LQAAKRMHEQLHLVGDYVAPRIHVASLKIRHIKPATSANKSIFFDKRSFVISRLLHQSDTST